MLNKKKNIILVVVGIVLAIVGLICTINVESGGITSRVSTLISSLGFGLLGGGLGSLHKIKRIEKIPGKSKQIEIEYNDERNELIRDKANAKAGDITNWFVLLIAYICIIMGYPNWLTFLVLGVFLLKYILWIVLIKKYNEKL